jgi:stress response protein SCP2
MLAPGANAPLSTGSLTFTARFPGIPGSDIDLSAFLVAANGKVRSDEDMCFYGQPSVANGAAVQEHSDATSARFRIDTSKLPADVDKVVLTATIHENTSTFGKMDAIDLDLGGVAGRIPCAGMAETALLLAEIYRRGTDWKVRVVGQGFKGGLAALATHLGVDIGAPAPAAAPAPAPTPAAPTAAQASAVRLQKKLVDLEKKDPQLVSLVKKVQVSLEKKKLAMDRAKVVLCLDISGSMATLYKSGAIDTLVQRVMALGYRFDDDGEIDVFLFGENVHRWGALGVDGYRTFVKDMQRKHPLEGGTRYGRAMEAIRTWAKTDNPEGLPIYVMFVTDGGTDDKPKTERELREASNEPIFWKFMAIGAKGRFSGARFEFLEKLDDLKNRTVDNADFFQVDNPATPSDEEMFDLLMQEYPQWLDAAAKARVLTIR